MRLGGEFTDLEALLYNGYLLEAVSLHKPEGFPFRLVLKTLSTNETDYIYNLCSGLSGYQFNYWFNVYFVAYSIFNIDGYPVTNPDAETLTQLVDAIQKWNRPVLQTVISVIAQLQNRVNKSASIFERYIYQKPSRFNWSVRKGSSGSSPNDIQEMWINYNQIEDMNEQFEISYSLAKFVASFLDPKGVRKIDSKDSAKRAEKDEYRQRIIENYRELDAHRLSHPIVTNDDLLEELDRQMRGIKDDHDRIIEEWERTLKSRVTQKVLESQRSAADKNIPVGVSSASETMDTTDVQHYLKTRTRRSIDPDRQPVTNYSKYFQMMAGDKEAPAYGVAQDPTFESSFEDLTIPANPDDESSFSDKPLRNPATTSAYTSSQTDVYHMYRNSTPSKRKPPVLTVSDPERAVVNEASEEEVDPDMIQQMSVKNGWKVVQNPNRRK